MSEIALVSSRKSKLETAARNGDRQAEHALALAIPPTVFYLLFKLVLHSLVSSTGYLVESVLPTTFRLLLSNTSPSSLTLIP